MRIAVLQPGYLPWLGFFDQLARVDRFVFYDDVQYDKHSWRNRNRIKTAAGPVWLSVPVLTKGRFGQRIDEVRIDPNVPWQHKHWASLCQAYSRTPGFVEHAGFFELLFAAEWHRLVDLDLAIIAFLAGVFGIMTPTVRSSELSGVVGARNDRLLSICQALGATEYLSGDAAETYLDVARFREHGVEVSFQRYEHPAYPQVHGAFVSHLSAVDVLFNCGAAGAGRILASAVATGAA